MEFSSCSKSSVESEKMLELFLEGLFEKELVIDAVVSQSTEHERGLWAIREQLPVCLMHLSRAPVEAVDSCHSGTIATR
jgi:hypothetical protein